MCNCKSRSCKTCHPEKRCCSKYHSSALRVPSSHKPCANKKVLKQPCSHKAPASIPRHASKPPRGFNNRSRTATWFESSNQESLRQRFLVAINRERRALSLPSLALNEVLNKYAAKHNYDQAFIMNKISHTGSDGSDLGDRKKRVGYSSMWCGENVAHKQETPEWCVRSLMKSPGHRKNIVNPRAKEMGVHGGIGKDGYWYWTQVLGAGPK